MTDRRAELEAAIDADPDDTRAYAVLADHLQELGDPRGELIALALAAEADPDLAPELDAFRVRHPELVGAVDAVRWRSGYVADAAADPAAVAALVDHSSGRFLNGLAVQRGDMQVAIAALAARERPSLRELDLGVMPPARWQVTIAPIGDLSALWPRLPRLTSLRVQGEAELGTLDPLVRLAALKYAANLISVGVMRSLARAHLPSLELLAVTGRLTPAVDPAVHETLGELMMLFEQPRVPVLQRLALAELDVGPVLERIVASPLVRQLRSLELSQCGLTDDHAEILLRHAGALAHLDSLELGGNRLSERAARSLATVARTVHAYGQDNRDDDLYDY